MNDGVVACTILTLTSTKLVEFYSGGKWPDLILSFEDRWLTCQQLHFGTTIALCISLLCWVAPDAA
ncbi:hypothetical protein BVC80_1831g316 [Macleaya cordata]|uniref:Uncharacterized protein n=1 Tax=Macleaya cordata TaxID=56857 RepID=A0A200R7S0_MACCD|nr:hypothetical protein BVC80_1831g316 [Macleaya cordata]